MLELYEEHVSTLANMGLLSLFAVSVYARWVS